MRGPVDALVVRLTALGLVAGMGLSLPLWFSGLRTAMPTVPVFNFLVDTGMLSFGVLVSGAFLGFYPNRKSPRLVLLLFLITAVLFDLNRLQAWVWFYVLLLTTVLFCQQTKSSSDQKLVFQWIIAAVYFWGGIFKITPYFAEDNFSWFCDAFAFMKPMGEHPILGYGLAAGEAVLGLGLLVPFTRSLFRYLALLFHGVIILILSPLGLNWNLVVIPWNFTMATMVWLLFADRATLIGRQHLFRLEFQFKWPQHIVLLAACLAPALNLIGFWPDALSWKMYSNTQSEATFYAPDQAPQGNVLNYWDQHAFNQGHYLLLDDWSNQELKTPLLPQRLVFMHIGRYLCNCTEKKDSAGLYILTVDPYHKVAEHMEFIPCERLLQQKR